MKKLYLAFTVDQAFTERIDRQVRETVFPFPVMPKRDPEDRLHVTLLYLDRVEDANESTIIALLDELFGGTAPHAAFLFSEWRVFRGNSNPSIGYLVLGGTVESANNWSVLRHAIRPMLKPFAPREDHGQWNPHVSVGVLPWDLVPEGWQQPLATPTRWEAQEIILYAKTPKGREILATFTR